MSEGKQKPVNLNTLLLLLVGLLTSISGWMEFSGHKTRLGAGALTSLWPHLPQLEAGGSGGSPASSQTMLGWGKYGWMRIGQ